MDDIAMAAMEMNASRFATQYSFSVQKMAMDDLEQAAAGELAMLPPTPGVGDYIDTYA